MQCTSGTDLLRRLHVIPHGDRCNKSSVHSRPVTVPGHPVPALTLKCQAPCRAASRVPKFNLPGFRTRMVYLHFITCLRYTILVRNPSNVQVTGMTYTYHLYSASAIHSSALGTGSQTGHTEQCPCGTDSQTSAIHSSALVVLTVRHQPYTAVPLWY